MAPLVRIHPNGGVGAGLVAHVRGPSRPDRVCRRRCRHFRRRYGYDILGRQLTQTDARGNTTTQTHDASGNLTSVADAVGNTASHTYDARNLRTDRLNPDATTISFGYDAVGLKPIEPGFGHLGNKPNAHALLKDQLSDPVAIDQVHGRGGCSRCPACGIGESAKRH